MNKIVWLLAGFLGVMLFCSGVRRIEKDPALTITPSTLRLFVDQHTDPYTIPVNYTLNIPAGFIPSCARLIYQPYFQAAGHRYDLTPLVISGRKNLRREKRLEALAGQEVSCPQAMRLTSTGDAMKIRLSETVPFQVWMAQSKLRADVTLEACNRKRHIEVLTLADGVIWFPQGPGPILVKYVDEMAEVPQVSEFSFFYPSGQDNFEREYNGNAARMQSMMRLIDSLQADTVLHLEKIVITGSASPSGNASYNKWLAGQRALLMKRRMVERRGINAQLIEVRNAGENRAGLQQLIRQSGMEGKEAVLKSWGEAKENVPLSRLPRYEYIRQHLFPELQRVSCEFYYTRREKRVKIVPE